MTGDGFLHRYFLNNPGKRIHKWMHYFDIYERHFERFRNKRPVILEIGVFKGGSLEMWSEYFGEGCTIIGVDIDPVCKSHQGANIEVFIGDQSDPLLIKSILDKYPSIDIVIDDGSHMPRDVIASFNILYSLISPNGVYLVEDVHVSYWENYDGALQKPGTFIEFCKQKIDELNAVNSRGAVPTTEFTASISSIVAYDGVIVFEKRPQGRRATPMSIGQVDSN